MDTFRDELVHWLSAPPWTLVSRGLINQCWEGVTLEYLGCFTLSLGRPQKPLPMPKWKRPAPRSLKAYSRRSGPTGESIRTPAPYPYPRPGLPLMPAGSPGIDAPLSRSVP
eukprot:scaffold718_cov342-Pavlova_lutheri.AAC.18